MSWLGAVGSVIGGIIGNESASAQMAFNREMQQKQIDWQREVLQNKIQWQTNDLRKAGLNPILAATQGQASGAAPNISAPQAPDKAQSIMSSARAVSDIATQLRDQQNRNMLATAQSSALDAAAQRDMSIAVDNMMKNTAGYWSSVSEAQQASAKANLAELQRVGLFGMQVQNQIRETDSRISQIKAGIDETYARIGLIKQQSQTEMSKRQLMYLSGELTRQQSALTQAQKETEFWRGLKTQSEIELLNLGGPRARYEAENYSNEWYKFITRTGDMMKSFLPLPKFGK